MGLGLTLGLGGLSLALGATLATALLLGGIESLLVGFKADGLIEASWSVVFLPLWLSVALVPAMGVASCGLLAYRRPCGPMWDCARNEPAEGMALSLAVVLLLAVLLPLVMTANLLLPLLDGPDAEHVPRPYSLYLVPLDVLLFALTLVCAARLCKPWCKRRRAEPNDDFIDQAAEPANEYHDDDENDVL